MDTASVLIAVAVVAIVGAGVLAMLARGVRKDREDRRKVVAEHPQAAHRGVRGHVITEEGGETVAMDERGREGGGSADDDGHDVPAPGRVDRARDSR